MITKNSDFKGRFYIANAEDESPNSDLVGNNEQLQLFIEEFEKKCLILVLGYTLYTELQPELLKKPFVPDATETADDKWVELVNGKANYEGLLPVLVPYIYFYFLQSDNSEHTGVGVTRDTPNGAVLYSAREKGVMAWKAFYLAAQGDYYSTLLVSKSLTPGNVLGIIYDNQEDKTWSLYKFLDVNKDVYKANMTLLLNINEYGI